MYWENSGTPSSMSCPDCDFTFDVDFVYDEASSSYTNAGCSEFEGDFSFAIGYNPDYYYPSYGPLPSVMYYVDYYSAWYWYGVAYFNETTGVLYHSNGVTDYYPVEYNDKNYYLTYLFYGKATIE